MFLLPSLSSCHVGSTCWTIPFSFWRSFNTNTRIMKPFVWTLKQIQYALESKVRALIKFCKKWKLYQIVTVINLHPHYRTQPCLHKILDYKYNIVVHWGHTNLVLEFLHCNWNKKQILDKWNIDLQFQDFELIIKNEMNCSPSCSTTIASWKQLFSCWRVVTSTHDKTRKKLKLLWFDFFW